MTVFNGRTPFGLTIPLTTHPEKGDDMKPLRMTTILLTVFSVLALLVLASCAGGLTPKNAPAVFPCVSPDKLEIVITPRAELVDFSCSFKKWEGAETLHFKVAVKNVSDQPQRYRVNIFLDNGKAVGGLIPRKTKKGLVKPGETASFLYPVKGMAHQPKSVMLRISTMGK